MLSWVKLELEKLAKECKVQSHYCYNIINSISEIRSMYCLEKDFQINVTIREYEYEKPKIIENYITKICENQQGIKLYLNCVIN